MSYVDVAGMRTWHEIDGTGEPVVLLRGAFGGASSWYRQRPALVAAGFRVYLPERRGHVHTPDVAGPLTYSVMADDTIAYLDKIVGGPTNLVGWSDGAVVGLLVAQRRPDLVKRLVLIGQYYNCAGKAPGAMDAESFRIDSDVVRFLRQEYDACSPDGPDHFPVVFSKTVDMIRTEPELELASLRGIDAETLVLQGDRDEVTVAHSVDVVAHLPMPDWRCCPGVTCGRSRAQVWSTRC
jgi:pimeloyl-ACP methyl ester carboxylesterase